MAAKIAEKGVCGFDLQVLSRADAYGINEFGGFDVFTEAEEARLLVLSKLGKSPNKQPKRKPKRKRTKNGKYVTYSDGFTHDGKTYRINNSQSYGVYSPTLHKMIEQLNVCLTKWRRVFMLRFDLHQKTYTANSTMVTQFRKNLSGRLQRAYEISKIGYAWCREQERAKQQHYHYVLFLDGDKINHPSLVSKMITDCWEAVEVGNYARVPNSGYYNIHIDDDETIQEAVYRFSYLAKQRGKGYRPKQAKDYGTSRLKDRAGRK